MALNEQNEDLVDYIGEILRLISSGKEDADMHHINLVAENIHSKALALHKEYISYLKNCRKEVKK